MRYHHEGVQSNINFRIDMKDDLYHLREFTSLFSVLFRCVHDTKPNRLMILESRVAHVLKK